jgi:serine/threonine protein phosphatase PrpC
MAHNVFRPHQIARIIESGGSIEFGRVEGCLAVTRALGDRELKQPAQYRNSNTGCHDHGDIGNATMTMAMTMAMAPLESGSAVNAVAEVTCEPVRTTVAGTDDISAEGLGRGGGGQGGELSRASGSSSGSGSGGAGDVAACDEFVLVACDGLFDVFTNQEVRRRGGVVR